MLLDEDDPQAAESLRQSIVAPAQRSNSARHKAAHKLSWSGSPVHSFQSMLADLATVVKNRIQPKHIDAIANDYDYSTDTLAAESFRAIGSDVVMYPVTAHPKTEVLPVVSILFSVFSKITSG